MPMYWDAVLKEVLNKKNPGQKFSFTNINEEPSNAISTQPKSKAAPKRILKKYALGKNYPEIHFTVREAQSMVYFLKGKTTAQTANALNLSPRTVEFYVKNMKTKLKCGSKSELIGKVLESDFVKNIDFT